MALLAIGIDTIAKQPKTHKKDVVTIVRVLNKALEAEFAYINEQVYSDTDLVEIDQIIKQRLEIIKSAFAHAVKHDLTSDQRTFVINLLQSLKAISATTTNDLMLMAEVRLVEGRSEAMDEASEKYCPQLMQKKPEDCTVQERIAWLKEWQKIDLHDESFNLLKNFMCQCAYLDKDVNFIVTIDSEEDEVSGFIQKSFILVGQAIVFPFVVFNDLYFVNGWQEKFKQSGDIFAILNIVSSALLDAIDQK